MEINLLYSVYCVIHLHFKFKIQLIYSLILDSARQHSDSVFLQLKFTALNVSLI